MLYRIYIYQSNAATPTAPALGVVNSAISSCFEKHGSCNDGADFMGEFEAEDVKEKIEAELGDKCKVAICIMPKENEQKKFLYIKTSYARIYEVLPRVHAIAMENRLALYDAETGRTFFKRLLDDTFITLKIREQEILKKIRTELRPIWKIRQISEYHNERDRSSCYCITVRKAKEQTFLARVCTFYNCLKSGLCEGEELICKDRCFSISGEWYTITFVLEGYKKQAEIVGYYEDGKACQDFSRRMSIEVAYKWMEGCTDEEKRDIQKRMNFVEMCDKFPNPADRFVNSVRITKWQRKQVFGVRYSGFGRYGSEILFHIVPDAFYDDAENISVLKIETSSASYILPFIHDIYPHFYARYYLAENYLPTEMWRDIIDRIKEAQDMVLHDTYCYELGKYIDRFNLFVLDEEDPRIWRQSDEEYRPEDFVYEHRYEIAYLYEIFIQWSETQMYYYDISGHDRMFNIQGP